MRANIRLESIKNKKVAESIDLNDKHLPAQFHIKSVKGENRINLDQPGKKKHLVTQSLTMDNNNSNVHEDASKEYLQSLYSKTLEQHGSDQQDSPLKEAPEHTKS